MRDFYRDQWDVRCPVLLCDNGHNIFVRLELDYQIDFFANQKIGITLRDLGIVLVVQADEFDAFSIRRALETCRNLLGKSVLGSLRAVPKFVQALLPGTQTRAVQILTNLLDHAAFLQCVEKPECHRFWKPAPRRNLPERKSFSGYAERRKQLRRVDDRFHQVWVARTSFASHGASSTESTSVYSRYCGQQNISPVSECSVESGLYSSLLKKRWLLTVAPPKS